MTKGVDICSTCGEKLKPGNRFCTHCGAPVSRKPAPLTKPLLPTGLTGAGTSGDEARRRHLAVDDERRRRERREREERERRQREDERRRRQAEQDRRRREEQARRRK